MARADKTSRDINARVKRAVGGTKKYAQGAGKMFLHIGGEFIKTNFPTPFSMVSTNKEVLDSTVKFLRNPVDNVNRQINRALATDDFKALRKFAKNTLDDLKTGEFYDPDRHRDSQTEEMDKMFADLDNDFGGFDLSAFDDDGNWVDEDPSTELGREDINTQIRIAAFQDQKDDERTTATVNAIIGSTQSQQKNDNANAQMSLRVAIKQHSEMMQTQQSLIQGQQATFELINKVSEAHANLFREAHNQVIDRFDSTISILKQIESNTKPPVKDDKSYKEPTDIFGNHGELNIKNYAKMVKKNFNEKFNPFNIGLGGVMGFDIKTIIESFGDNPVDSLLSLALEGIIPKKTREQMTRTSKNMEGFLPAILQKMGERGRLYETGKSDKWTDALMGILAPETKSRTGINTSYNDPLKAAQLTNKTVRAIEEVIPMWLSRIDSHLTGGPLMIYDYSEGKLKKAGSVIESNERSNRDLSRDIDGYYEAISRAKSYNFKSEAEQKKFLDFIYQYFQNAGETGKFINPWADKDKFMRGMDLPEGSNYYELLAAILQNMNPEQSKIKGFSKSAALGMAGSIATARENRNRRNNRINRDLSESGQIAAWSFIDDDTRNAIIESSLQRHTNLSDTDIENISNQKRKAILKNGGVNATNTLLSDILKTLRSGIITFTTKLPGKTPDLPDYIKSKIRKSSANGAVTASHPMGGGEDITNPIDAAVNSLFADTMSMEDAIELQGSLNYDKKEDERQREIERLRAQGKDPTSRYENMARDKKKYLEEKFKESNLGKLVTTTREIANKPFQLFNTAMQMMDDMMYKALFGVDALNDPDAPIDEDSSPSILKTTMNLIAGQIHNLTGFLERGMHRLDDYLFDAREGIIPKAMRSLGEMLGFDELKDKAKAKAKAVREKITNKVVGKKDEESGEYAGGILSGYMNNMKKGKMNLADQIKGSINRLLYGDLVATKGKLAVDLNEQGEVVELDKVQYSGVIGSLKKGFDGLKDFLFGEGTEDKNGSKEKWKKVKGAFKEAAPNMAVGSGIGALASIFLPGGPVLGAILGATTGLVTGSNQLKEYLFGKYEGEEDVIDPKTGKVELDWRGRKKTRKKQTKAGIFSQDFQDSVKKVVPAGLAGAVGGNLAGKGIISLGAKMGILPATASVLPFTILGIGAGLMASSDNFKKMIFGDSEDPKSGLISKEFRGKAIDFLKKTIPHAAGGAVIGSKMAGLMGSIGILPGFMLGPGGPIMATLGAITVGSQAKKINKFLFGEETETTEQVTNPDGTTSWVKKKAREGGIFNKAYDFMKEKVMEPIAKGMNKMVKGIGEWFKSDILGPLGRSIEPLKEKLGEAGKSIRDSLANIGNHIATGITKSLGILPEGEDMKSFWEKNVKGKLKDTVNKLFSALGKMIGNILSAPFKALEAVVRGGRDKDNEEENDKKRPFGKIRDKFDELAAKGHKRRLERAGKNLGRAGRDVGIHFSNIGERINTAVAGMTSLSMVNERTASRVTEYNRTKGNNVATGETTRVVDGMSIDALNSMKPEDAIKRLRFKMASGGKLGADEQAWFTNYMKNKKGTKSKTRVPVASVEDAKVSKSDDAEAKKEKAKKEREARSEERNRKKATKRAKDQHDYLRSISKHTKGIYDEIHGQLGGVGWNIAYIKTLLEKQMGPLKDEELPEEMEGSKKVSKKRGFFGKAKDAIGGFFGGIFDKVGEFGGKIKGGLGKIGRGVKGVFSIIFHPFQMLGKLVGFLFEQAKGLFSALWEGLKGGIKLLTDVVHTAAQTIIGAARGIGEALGSAVSLFAGTVKDLALSATALIRGSLQFLADTVPALAADVIHFGVGLAKGVVKSGVKLGKKAWSGIKGIGRKIKARHDKKKGITTETKIKNIGTFQIDGGYLDTVGETFPMIGDKLTPTPIPVVEMFKGKAHGIIPKAIPVYVANDVLDVIQRIRPTTNNKDDKLSDDYKRAYAEVDKAAETSGNPNESYDKKMAKAKTKDERDAILAAAQLNAVNGSLVPVETKKEEGGSILDLLTGGNVFSNLLKKVGTWFTGTALYKTLMSIGSTVSTIATLLGGGALAAATFTQNMKDAHESYSEGETMSGSWKVAKAVAQPFGVMDLGRRLFNHKAKVAKKANDLAKATKNQKIADKFGKVADFGGNVAKNAITKLGNSLKSAINKFLGESAVDSAIKQIGNNNSIKSKIATFLTKHIDDALEGVAKASASKIVSKINIFLLIASAVVDFVTGYNKADRLFNVDHSNLTVGMKITSGIGNAISGLTCGLISEETITNGLYNLLASAEDKENLRQNQAKLQSKVDAYNAANSTDYSVDQYQARFKENGDKRHISFATKVYNAAFGQNEYGEEWTDEEKAEIGKKAVERAGQIHAFGAGRRMKHFSQRDPRWNHGTDMAASGCGPTAAAMVGSVYGDKRSPLTANSMSYGMGMRAGDGGTNPAFFGQYAGSNYGMTQGPNSSGMVARNLNKGQPVILMGKGGAFGDGMHYMVADKMNGGSSVNLVDPYTGGSKSANLGRLMKNTSSTVYSFGRGSGDITATQSGKGNIAGAQQALMDKLAGIQGQITYSTSGAQDPDKGNASCASMMNWAYRKVFPDVFEGKPMSSNAWDQTLDSRFKTIFVQTGGKKFDLSQFQPGDLLYFDSRTANGSIENNRMEHVDMYAGNGQIWYHGGGSSGNQMGPIMKPFNEWRYKNLMMVRRYIPFIDGSVKTYDDSEITYSNPNGSAGIYGSTSTGSSDSSSADYGDTALGNIFGAIGAASTGLDNLWSKLFTGSSDDEETSSGAAYDDASTSTGNSGAIVSNVLGAANYTTSLTSGGDYKTNGPKIWKYFRDKGLTNNQTAAIVGNLWKESALKPENVSDYYNRTTGITDQQYTDMVDDGSYSNFANDEEGYGLAMWTHSAFKQPMYEMAKKHGKSIGDLGFQLDYLWDTLNGQWKKSTLDPILASDSLEDGAVTFMQNYEKPYGMDTDSKKNERIQGAHEMLEMFGTGRGRDMTNLNAMNGKVRNINTTMTKLAEFGRGESTAVAATNRIAEAIENSEFGKGPQDGTTTQMLELMTKTFGKMIELLSEIKDNTANISEVTNNSGSDDDSSYVRGDNYSTDMTGSAGNQTNYGKDIIDRLTKR